MEVAQAYNSILTLTRDVSTYYYAKVNGMLSSEASFDFTSLFKAQIRGFISRKNRVVELMWREQLGEHDLVDVATLRSWLSPDDHKLEKLHENQSLTPDHRDEYTCEWFQRHLIDFTRGDEDVLALFGQEGCGKTYLSRWIVERLQRPLSKKTCKLFLPINLVCPTPFLLLD